jgi:hypothetical protein
MKCEVGIIIALTNYGLSGEARSIMDKPNQQTQEPREPVRLGRRKLLTGTAAGAGVFLAMQAKTALGTTSCQSPSAMISGNTSPRPGDGTTCSGGRSPGFWKVPQHFPHWKILRYPTFKSGIVACSAGLGNVSPSDINDPGTPLSYLGTCPGSTRGVWEVLAWPTLAVWEGKGQLMRALVCAYLNAAYFTSASEKYPLTTQQVKDMWNATVGGGTYCPAGISCGTNAMTASQIIDYIQGMYGINSDVVNLCKANN